MNNLISELVRSSEKRVVLSTAAVFIISGFFVANFALAEDDATAPEIGDVTIGPSSYPNSGTIYIFGVSDISASVTETGSGVASCEYTLNSSSWLSATYSADEEACSVTDVDTSLASSINIRAIDNAENVGTGVAIYVTPDTIAPVTTIGVSVPNYGTNPIYISPTTQLTLNAIDGGADVITTQYQIDEEDLTYYFEAFTISTEGTHTIFYRSSDYIDNIEEFKSLSVYVDDVVPSVTGLTITSITVNGGINYISAVSNISATVTDNNGPGIAGCKYTLNGGTNWTAANYNSETNLCEIEDVNTSLASLINIQATDNVGNVGTGSAIHVTPDTAMPAPLDVVIVDNEPPITSDNYGTKNNLWQNTDQTITLTPADAGSSGILWTRYCTDEENQCNPAVGFNYTGAVSISTEGITYFRYTSKDNNGNIQATVSRTVKIDKNDEVDIIDFNTLMINWGNSPANSAADLDNNGKVDIFDFNLLMVNWG